MPLKDTEKKAEGSEAADLRPGVFSLGANNSWGCSVGESKKSKDEEEMRSGRRE